MRTLQTPAFEHLQNVQTGKNGTSAHVRPAALLKTDSKERAGTFATRIIRKKGKRERGEGNENLANAAGVSTNMMSRRPDIQYRRRFKPQSLSTVCCIIHERCQSEMIKQRTLHLLETDECASSVMSARLHLFLRRKRVLLYRA